MTPPESNPSTETPQASFAAPHGSAPGWAVETMMMINKLTPKIKGKAFDPDWFLLRERLEEAGRVMDERKARNAEAKRPEAEC